MYVCLNFYKSWIQETTNETNKKINSELHDKTLWLVKFEFWFKNSMLKYWKVLSLDILHGENAAK